MSSRRSRRLWAYLALGLATVLVLRVVLVQSFAVPSGSMEPTIQPGDRLLVNRLARGEDLHRGDIVVFDGSTAFPAAPDTPEPSAVARLLTTVGDWVTADRGTDYVKRIVGMPGDRVTCCDPAGRLLVNGVPVDEAYLSPGDRPSDLTFDVLVPSGHLWVMGDHRSESGDSRSYLGRPGGGMVPLEDVVGQATVRYWPPGRLGSLGGPGPLASIPPATLTPVSPATPVPIPVPDLVPTLTATPEPTGAGQ